MPTLGVVMKQVKGVVHRYLHIAELSEIDENPSIIVPDQVPRPEIAMLELTTHGGHIRQRSVDRVDDGGIDADTTQQFQARLYLRAQVDERRAREKTGQGKGRWISTVVATSRISSARRIHVCCVSRCTNWSYVF